MDIGCRVVRGPDWEWGDQDGGEGCVGTVVEGPQKEANATVWVQWDTGSRANYRAGFDGKLDLRVYDNSGTGKRVKIDGSSFMCDGCDQNPVMGTLWLCRKCNDYGLCTSCYMADKHKLDCPFDRINTKGQRVPVGKREGATKIQARGTFSGARVDRGPDWRWGHQNGGPGGQGTVVERKDGEKPAKSGVVVKWDRTNKENAYRLGFKGKVDVISVTPETGGFYYRDHLPDFEIRAKKTVSGFTTEDRVRVNVKKEQLVKMAEEHGGWNDDMEKCILKIGVVHDFTKSGDVIVDYDGIKWRFSPEAITKVEKFKKGDKVLVNNDQKLVEKLQENHGGWNPSMKTMLGMIGTVLKSTDDNNNVLIRVEGNMWLVSSAILTLHEAAKEKDRDEGDDDDDEIDMNDPLQSFFKQQNMIHKLLSDAFSDMFTDDDLGNKKKDEDDEGFAVVQAAAHGHVSRVTQALDARPDLVNYVSKVLGKTCLHMACHSGYCDIVTLLLEKNADTSIKDGQGYTAIHHAAYGDKSGEALKLMLAHGVDPNIRNNDVKCTPLHLAVAESNHNAVRILVQTDTCDVNLQDAKGETPLHAAITNRSNTIVDLLLDAKNINLTLTNKHGFNFLHLAAYKGNPHAARKLLEKSPELVNIPKDDGFTSLHLCAVNDHCEIAEIILARSDCKVDCRTKKNQTPLVLAVHEGYLKMVKILEQHGADVNGSDEDGDTPLHVSLMREKFFSVGMGKMLGLFGNNSSSYVEISRYLISHGANVRQVNQAGKSPMEYGEGTKVEPELRKAFEESRSKEKKKTESGEKKIVNNFTDREAGTVQKKDRKVVAFREEDEVQTSYQSLDNEEEFQNSTSNTDGAKGNAPMKKTKVTCLICIDAQADVLFKPCGHTVLCRGCSVRAKRCPECKELVTNKTTEDGKQLPPDNVIQDIETKEKLQSTEIKLKKLEELVTCCVCLDRKKNIIFSCGHGACQVCAEQLGVCAICKKEIQRKVAMF